jgi:amidophosphoribosyltransferase
VADLAARNITASGTTDSELAALWIANAGGETWEDNIQRFMKVAQGAYSMALLTEQSLYAFRDPHGVRPLQIGRTDEAWAVSSETLTFRTLGYRPYRAVAPGELVRIDTEGFRTISHRPAEREALCVFEYVYFSRPDSELDGEYVNRVRKRLGQELAREAPADVDVVTPVPQSGNPFAEGYAAELGIPHEVAFARNAYVGRSFIDPGDRRSIVEMKLNPFVDVVRRKRVCLVDDSIVRGNTMPTIVDMLWDAGATEGHVRIGSPPLLDTCHLGVDIPTPEELIANGHSTEEIQNRLKAHSLAYLSEAGMYRAVRREANTVCAACMTGQRPFPGAAPESAN